MLSAVTNMGSLSAQNALETSRRLSAIGQTRLATGLKINTAADDAAGASMLSKLIASITGTKRGIQNAAIAMIQKANVSKDILLLLIEN